MSQTYPSAYFQTIDEVERSHFWFLSRNEMLTNLVNKFLPKASKPAFLEVGCGTGVALRLFEKLGYKVTGLDVNQKALQYAKHKTNARLIQRSIYSFIINKQYYGVGAFDVLEHQTKDVEFLKCCGNLLVPGGFLFLTVPACRRFWSRIDSASGHKRRYEVKELREKAEAAGFIVRYCNYWNILPLPFFLFDRSILSIFKKDKQVVNEYLKVPHPVINKSMGFLLTLEQKMMFRLQYPIGATLVLAAQKP